VGVNGSQPAYSRERFLAPPLAPPPTLLSPAKFASLCRLSGLGCTPAYSVFTFPLALIRPKSRLSHTLRPNRSHSSSSYPSRAPPFRQRKEFYKCIPAHVRRPLKNFLASSPASSLFSPHFLFFLRFSLRHFSLRLLFLRSPAVSISQWEEIDESSRIYLAFRVATVCLLGGGPSPQRRTIFLKGSGVCVTEVSLAYLAGSLAPWYRRMQWSYLLL